MADVLEFQSDMQDFMGEVNAYLRRSEVRRGDDVLIFALLPSSVRADASSLVERSFDLQGAGLDLLSVAYSEASRSGLTSSYVRFQHLSAAVYVVEVSRRIIQVLMDDPSMDMYQVRVDMFNMWDSVRSSWSVLDQ